MYLLSIMNTCMDTSNYISRESAMVIMITNAYTNTFASTLIRKQGNISGINGTE